MATARRKSRPRNPGNGPRGTRAVPSRKMRRIVHAIKSHLELTFGGRVRQVILYGSQARGDATEESDVDVAIIVDDSLEPIDIDLSLEDLLLEFILEDKELVSVVILKESMFLGRSTPLIMNIKREGVVA